MPNPAWMTNIPNNGLLLRHITMPASHDAGVSTVHNAGKGFPVPSGMYICQSQDIAGQLTSGSRFFDVRFSMNGGVPTTVHETAGSGGWGETAAGVFAAINAHLTNNPGEIVIVRVSHTDAATGAAVFVAQQANLALARTYTNGSSHVNLANTSLRNLRGRAIVAYGSDAMANPAWNQGQIRFGKADHAHRNGIVTCGEYPNSNDMALIRYKSAKRTNEHRRQGGQTCNAHSHNDHLFMLYWQMTGGNVGTNTRAGGNPPVPIANHNAFNGQNGTHYNLSHMVDVLAGDFQGQTVTHGHTFSANSVQQLPAVDANRYLWVPNIINLDFVSDAVCDVVVAFNQAHLTAAGLWVAVA
jgi:hypothetical protein